MKFLLPVVLLYSSSLFAQYNIKIETPFNKFIKSSNIEWAINAKDTLLCEKLNLADLLIKKMYDGKIKTSSFFEQDSKDEKNLKFTSIENNDRIINGDILEIPLFDSLGNIIEITKVKKLYDSSSISGLLNIYQKYLIEKNKLKSYISYISPIKTIITPSGKILGNGELFTTAFNYNYNYTSSKTDKIIYLTTTTKDLYVDSIKKENKLKEIFGHNLIESLWPYIETNKIKIQLLPNNKQTTLKEINANNLLNLETINIPLYDNEGNQSGFKKIITETTPNLFDKITITQVWYYNDTKNIVYCKIPSALLTVKKYPENDFMNNTVRQIKLVF